VAPADARGRGVPLAGDNRISPSFDKAKLEQEIATQDTQTRHTEAQTSRLLFMLAIGSR
jgi:hypothetical protein